MRKYLGTGRTSWFNDHQIRTREFVRWADARRDFAHRQQDRDKVKQLSQLISRDGLQTPLILGVSDRYPDVYIGDGHHRAIVLMNLGVRTLPFHWYWIHSFGVTIESNPFPYDLLGEKKP